MLRLSPSATPLNRLCNLYVLSGILLVTCLLVSISAKAGSKPYTFAVVPQFTPLKVHRDWTPFLKKISRDTGVDLKLKVYPNFKQFLGDIRAGRPDFVFLAPFHAVIAKRVQGYIPLVRDDSHKLVGILVVRKDSKYHSLHDIEGMKIAFPSPTAFAASVYLRAYLAEKEKLHFKSRYVGTHDNVYRHVLLGRTAAGGGVNNTFARQPETLKNRLKVLYRLPGVASHPVSVHPRVPEEVRKKLVADILEMYTSAKGRVYLRSVQLQHPVPASYTKDYQFLEGLQLEKYMK